MKILLALLMTAFAAHSAWASTDVADDVSSANLVNLNYYAHAGNLLVEPSFDTNINTLVGGTRRSRSAFVIYGEYGLPWVPGLRIGISESDVSTTNIASQTTFAHTGLGDPTFDVLYRVLDQTPGGFSLDTELSFSPSIASSDIAYANIPGGSGKGYSMLELSAVGFWRMAMNEVSVHAGVTRDFSGTQSDPENLGYEIPMESEWIASAGIHDRVHLLPTLFVQGEVAFNFAKTRTTSYNNGNVIVGETPFNVEPAFVLGFLAKKDVLISAYIQYQSYTTSGSYNAVATSSTFISTTGGFHVLIEI